MLTRQGRDGLTYDEVRRALERVNIDCTDTQFTKLMTEIDADGDGNVTHQEFLSYMKESERKSFKEEAVGVVAPRDVNQCIAMIQSKIQERLEGGPAGLRRAFQYFDADGSGDIDMDEVRHQSALSPAPLRSGAESLTGVFAHHSCGPH